MNSPLEYSVKLDENSKVPIRLPPTLSPNRAYQEEPILDFLDTHARRRSDVEDEFSKENSHLNQLPNIRRRRHEDEQSRLLSQSAFNRISETLGALNTVGNFFLNITREVNSNQHNRGDMKLISSSSIQTTRAPIIQTSKKILTDELYTSSTEQSIPDALLKITKNVLGPNMTRTIEPLILSDKEPKVDKQNEKIEKIDRLSLNEKIDMAALAEKKRKKHQALSPKIDKNTEEKLPQLLTTVSPGTGLYASLMYNRCTSFRNAFYRIFFYYIT